MSSEPTARTAIVAAEPAPARAARGPERGAPAQPGEVVIGATNVGKVYHIYARPQDRLKQALWRWRRTYHREFWAVKGVNFEARRGETVGVIGRNGAGKSTLLQIIAGVLAPSTGEVRVKGRVVPLLELGSGFNPEFTGRENVYLYGRILGLSREFIDRRFAEIEAFADIGMFIDQPLKTYSSGMHARLAFSVASFVDPDILIVDEILAVGDAAFKAKCTKVFHRLRDKGCTIILVGHDPYLIKTFCHRALYLSKGEQVAFGPADVVTQKYQQEIEAAQLADRTVERGPKRPETDLTAAGLFRIDSVDVLDESGSAPDPARSGSTLRVRFRYTTLRASEQERVTFVFSLYRHDSLYICGTTTLMDKLRPMRPGTSGEVEVEFPSLRLLGGNYYFRVAIDDDRGFGIHAEAHTRPFRVADGLEAVGLVNLERRWTIRTEGGDGTD